VADGAAADCLENARDRAPVRRRTVAIVTEHIPLFPLNTVLFPGMPLPLLVFEERYRSLVRDLLSRPVGPGRAFGVVAIREGFEVGSDTRRSVHRTGTEAECVEIGAHEDGTFDVVVVGRRRFFVNGVREGPSYLVGDVEWLGEPAGPAGAAALAMARAMFERYRTAVARLYGRDVPDLDGHAEPLRLSYALAANAWLPLPDRQRLLEVGDTTTRLTTVTAMLRAELAAMRAIPSLPATQPVGAAWSPN
jgi:Lon protease-like protein